MKKFSGNRSRLWHLTLAGSMGLLALSACASPNPASNPSGTEPAVGTESQDGPRQYVASPTSLFINGVDVSSAPQLATRLVDGNLFSSWSSGNVNNPTVMFTLAKSAELTSLEIKLVPRGETYEVDVYSGGTWKTVLRNQRNTSGNIEKKPLPAGTTGNMVRLRFSNGGESVQIYEVRVMGGQGSPTPAPSSAPSTQPSTSPSVKPTTAPTAVPTLAPTPAPTAVPTPVPTVAPTATPGPATPPIWDGSFETGNFSPYIVASHNFVGASQPTIVTDRVRSGRYAAKFTINPGAQRTELTPVGNDATHFTEGEDLYFGYSIYFDNNWPTAKNWQIVTQWKQDGDGTPPLQMSAEGDKLELRGQQYATNTAKRINFGATGIPRGRWTDFVVHVKFSTNSSVGFVEGWRDGVKVVQKTPWQTMVAGRSFNYWKQGIYRDTATPSTGTLWSDNWKIGKSYDAVVPR